MAAIPNRIVIGNDQSNPILAFENTEIISVNSDTSVSLVGEELYINQFDATVDYFVWEPYVFNPADEPDQTYGPYSGETVSFETDGVANVTEMEVGLAPIQDLSQGNPSPTNICPITGHSGSSAYVKAAYDASATATVSVTFTDQGTVYGGSYDFVSGKLTVTKAWKLLNDSTKWKASSGTLTFVYDENITRKLYSSSYTGLSCSYVRITSTASALKGRWQSASGGKFGIQDPSGALTLADVQAAAVAGKIEICYDIEPIVYDLTPQAIQTLSGQNVAWSNAGSINTFTAVLQGESCDGFMSSDNKLLCSRKNYDIRLLPYGTKIVYYSGGNIAGVFYVKTVERVQRAWYKISGVSAIGLLDKQNHTGGIYTGQYFQDVVTDILGNDYDYIIDGVVAIQRVYGWLPYDTKRNNLYQLLLAYGVEIVLGDSGAMFFTFPEATEAIPISTDRVFTGGKVIYDEPASLVEVSEHSYHYDPNVDEVVLFDNSTDEAVTFAIIKFDEPIYPTSIYCSSGNLTISETTTNYAVVSGAGILKGIPYVHNVRLISKTNANAPVEKVVSVQDATLVSFINADNVLERLSEYYFNATRVEQDIKVLTEKPGQLYTTQDPFNQIITGYITRMSKSVTSFARARCRFLQNYTPVGSGQAYTERVVIPLGQGASETWTIPASVFEKDIPIFRVVLIGKGRDGENGQNGKRGGGDGYKAMPGGAGGKGGAGGVGGNVLTVTLNATGLTSITVANSGTESVLMSQYYNYSSADGGPNTFGYFDILTGELLAIPGLDGVDGGNGGYGDYYTHNATAESTAADGEDVVYNGTTYHGGTHGNRRVIGGGQVGISESMRIYVAGTGGGGAAVGSDGGDGLNTATKLGSAGNGADADPAPPASLVYGAGGNGGHGGGGGGGRGMSEWYNVSYQAVIGTNYAGDNGYGGAGSSGTPGQFGCAIIYY